MKLRVKQQMLINAVCSTRPGGVLELSTFNYFFAGAFFAGVVFVRHKQSSEQKGNSGKQSAHASKGGHKSAAHTASSEDGNDWIEKVNQTVPMQIIKIGNGAEAAQAMLRLLFLHKKSIH